MERSRRSLRRKKRGSKKKVDLKMKVRKTSGGARFIGKSRETAEVYKVHQTSNESSDDRADLSIVVSEHKGKATKGMIRFCIILFFMSDVNVL
jgi:hypothetical protein